MCTQKADAVFVNIWANNHLQGCQSAAPTHGLRTSNDEDGHVVITLGYYSKGEPCGGGVEPGEDEEEDDNMLVKMR